MHKPAFSCCSPQKNPLLLVETPRYTNRSSGLDAPPGMLPTQLSGWYLSCLQPACDTTAEMSLVCMRPQRWSQFCCRTPVDVLPRIYKQTRRKIVERKDPETRWSPCATAAAWLSCKRHSWTPAQTLSHCISSPATHGRQTNKRLSAPQKPSKLSKESCWLKWPMTAHEGKS